MSRRFQIGDRVRVHAPDTGYAHHGKVTTITDCRSDCRSLNGLTNLVGYELDLPNTNKDPAFPRAWLGAKHLVPHYDGDEKTSWSALADIWTPKGVSA